MRVSITRIAGLLAFAQPGTLASQGDLVPATHAVLDAAYAGRLDSLEALAARLGAWPADHPESWLARYHAGFSHFVLALMRGPNGLDSARGDPQQMAHHVDQAVVYLEASVAARPGMADALALLGHLHSMRLRANPRVAPTAGPRARELLAEALALEPANPRVVLIDAMRMFWTPADRGGDREAGLRRWLEATQLFSAESDRSMSSLPAWGHAEAWAWLPAAYLALVPRDVARAAAAADRALSIRPGFRWVHVTLLPRIQAAAARAGEDDG